MRGLGVGVVVGVAACGRMGFDVQRSDGAADGADGSAADVDSTPVPGCIAGETPGPFTTDFEQGVPTFGMIFEEPPSLMDVFQGQLRGRPAVDPSPDLYATFDMDVADFRERRVFVQIPTMVNTAGCAQVTFNIQDDDITRYSELSQDCGQLHAVLWSGTTPTMLATIEYDPVLHRWWQQRAHAGTLTFEVSADGITWTPFATTATPAYFDDAYLELASGTYRMEPMTIGEVRFDDLFDCFAQ